MSNIIKREEIEQGAVSVENLKYQIEMVRQVMNSLMKDGVHYGKIPGSHRPVLLQAGADLLAAHFGISIKCDVDYEERSESLYRVRIRAEAYKGDRLLGSAFGEASTEEEKYKWRKAVCDEEYELTPEGERRIRFRMSYGKVEKIKQVRIPVPDVSNTVLKMAQKRAKVAVIRAITASSDIFEQDIEDMPAEVVLNESESISEKESAVRQYNEKQAVGRDIEAEDVNPFDTIDNVKTITEKQAKRLFAIARGKGLDNDKIKDIIRRVAGVEHSRDIPIDKYDEVISEIEKQ